MRCDRTLPLRRERAVCSPLTLRSSSTAAELRKLLDGTAPRIVKERLLDSLSGCSAKQLDALTSIFEPLRSAEPSAAHCLRCHEAYDRTIVDHRACTVKHEEGMGYNIEGLGGTYRMSLSCCGLEWDDSDYEQEPPTDYCFEGPHTDRLSDVEDRQRTDEELADSGDFDDDGYVVKTCAQAGCK